MPDEDKTGGGGDQITAGGSQTTTAEDKVPAGVQARIDRITATSKTEVEKAEARAKAAEEERDALREKNKTEQEKAMDQRAQDAVEQFKLVEHAPLAASAEQMKGLLETQVEQLKGAIPEDKRPKSFDVLPLVQRFEAYKALAESLNVKTTATRIDSGGGGGDGKASGKRVWKISEIRDNNNNPEWWKEHGPDVKAAQTEKRILYDQ
jgi:hypothetical protein